MADISPDLQQELGQLQAAYKAAVEKFTAVAEEALASAATMSPSSTNGSRPFRLSTSCTKKPTTASASTRTLRRNSTVLT